MPTPAAQDVFDLLENFNIGLTTQYPLVGTFGNGATVITAIDTTNLARGMSVVGANIPAETFITAVVGAPGPGGSVNISKPTTGVGAAQGLTVVWYTGISESWLVNARDGFVIPYIANKLRMSFQGVQTATEYYSGNGGSVMMLRRRPIIDLISISYTNVVSNQYYISPLAIQIINEEGILKARANFNEANYTPIFARGERNLRIIYTYGGTDYPVDVFRMITLGMADRALVQIANRTGGGTGLSVQGFSRNWPLGKFGDMRKEMARELVALMKTRMTGITVS